MTPPMTRTITQAQLAAAPDRHSLPRLTSLEASDPARAIGFAGGTVWRCSCGDWEFRVLPATGGLNNERPYGAFNRHVAAAIFATLPPSTPTYTEVERLDRPGNRANLDAALPAQPDPALDVVAALRALVDVVGHRIMDGELALAWHDAAAALRAYDADKGER